jgi:hypothetical protein
MVRACNVSCSSGSSMPVCIPTLNTSSLHLRQSPNTCRTKNLFSSLSSNERNHLSAMSSLMCLRRCDVTLPVPLSSDMRLSPLYISDVTTLAQDDSICALQQTRGRHRASIAPWRPRLLRGGGPLWAGSAVRVTRAPRAGGDGPAVDRPTRGQLPQLRPPAGEGEGEEQDTCDGCYSAHDATSCGGDAPTGHHGEGIAPLYSAPNALVAGREAITRPRFLAWGRARYGGAYRRRSVILSTTPRVWAGER